MHYIKNNSGLLFVFLIGLTLGILSAFGHTYLPRDFEPVVASYSIWLASTFVAGLFSVSKKQAIAYGIAMPATIFVVALAILKIFLDGGTVITSLITMLLVGSLIVGPVLAYLALRWKQGSSKALIVAPVLMSSLFISEGLAGLIRIGPDALGYSFIALGIAAFALLYRQTKERLLIIPMIAAIIPASVLIYFMFIMAFAIALTMQYSGSGLNDF